MTNRSRPYVRLLPFIYCDLTASTAIAVEQSAWILPRLRKERERERERESETDTCHRLFGTNSGPKSGLRCAAAKKTAKKGRVTAGFEPATTSITEPLLIWCVSHRVLPERGILPLDEATSHCARSSN